MIARAKAWAKRRWPRLALRTYLFASFFVVTALPGVGACTRTRWCARRRRNSPRRGRRWRRARRRCGIAPATDIDLSATPILPPRPPPQASAPPLRDAQAAATTLAPILADTRRATLASIILLDRAGRTVTGTPRGSYAALPEVASALAGTPGTVLRRNAAFRATYRFDWLSRAAALRVHHARSVLVGGRVVGVLLLSRSARSLFAGLAEDRGKIAFGVLAIPGALVVLSGLLSRGIARPIAVLRGATRAVAAGRGAVPAVPPTAAVEIQDLYRDFAAMAEVIDARARYLRDFAHAVSHEFKTPLTGIRGALELLRDHAETMTPGERQGFLDNADADAARLTALVTRLLELARADMMPGGQRDATDVVAVARKLADALASRTVAVTVRAGAAPALARIADTAFETVLATLIENGVEAGARTIAVDVAVGRDVLVTVTDDGSGIPPADRTRVFESFFTSRRATGGTGLGLAIARSLLSATGGKLRLLERARTTFQLRLPKGEARPCAHLRGRAGGYSPNAFMPASTSPSIPRRRCPSRAASGASSTISTPEPSSTVLEQRLATKEVRPEGLDARDAVAEVSGEAEELVLPEHPTALGGFDPDAATTRHH